MKTKSDMRFEDPNGVEIDRLRRSNGWTKERLAETAGVSVSTVVRAINGVNLRVQLAQRIAAAFGIERAKIFRSRSTPIGYRRRPTPVTDWLSRINRSLDGSLRVVRVLDEDPKLIHHGPLPLSPEIIAVATDIAHTLPHNDSVAVLCHNSDLDTDPIQLHYKDTKYADTRALRLAGENCILLSGVGLLVCSETEELVLLRRSEKYSFDYKCDLHVFGGACCPMTDHDSLFFTAQREIVEESKIAIFGNPKPLVIVIDEHNIGFLQFALVGVSVSKCDVDAAEGNEYEGDVEKVAFTQLQEALMGGRSWVPSARANILTWLAHGAPLSDGSMALFKGLTGHELFDRVVVQHSV